MKVLEKEGVNALSRASSFSTDVNAVAEIDDTGVNALSRASSFSTALGGMKGMTASNVCQCPKSGEFLFHLYTIC